MSALSVESILSVMESWGDNERPQSSYLRKYARQLREAVENERQSAYETGKRHGRALGMQRY